MEVIKTESYPQVTPFYSSECTIRKQHPTSFPGRVQTSKQKKTKNKKNKDIEVNVE
jgi:hypothetical protein